MDLAQIRNLEVIAEEELFFRRFKGGRILLLSPNIYDFFFWKKILPNSNFTISTKSDWDLEFDFDRILAEIKQKQMKSPAVTKARLTKAAVKRPYQGKR